MPDIGIGKKLRDRLDFLRREYGIDDEDWDKPEEVVEGLFSAITYYYPDSAYMILQGLLWCTNKPIIVDGWVSDELNTAITMLDFGSIREPSYYERMAQEYGQEVVETWIDRDRVSANLWQEELDSWPLEDRNLVYEWLLVAETWDMPEGVIRDHLGEVLQFWRGVME